MLLSRFADIEKVRRPDLHVLDVPAGTGVIALPLKAAGFEVTACDLFPSFLHDFVEAHHGRPVSESLSVYTRGWYSESLKQRLFDGSDPVMPTDLECVPTDMEARLPFDDATFDIVVSAEGIEHVSDRYRLIAQFRRVLKKGGTLIITTPNMMCLRARMAFALAGWRTLNCWLDEYTGVQGRSEDGSRIYHGHAFLLDYNEIRYCLHNTGFRLKGLLPMQLSRTSQLLAPLMWPFVWAATRRSCRMGRRKFERARARREVPQDAMNPAPEIYRHLMSPQLLYTSTMAVEAEAI